MEEMKERNRAGAPAPPPPPEGAARRPPRPALTDAAAPRGSGGPAPAPCWRARRPAGRGCARQPGPEWLPLRRAAARRGRRGGEPEDGGHRGRCREGAAERSLRRLAARGARSGRQSLGEAAEKVGDKVAE